MVALNYRTINVYTGPRRVVVIPINGRASDDSGINTLCEECTQALKAKRPEYCVNLERLVDVGFRHISAIVQAVKKSHIPPQKIYVVTTERSKQILELAKLDNMFNLYETPLDYIFLTKRTAT